mmetsp:Transcript_28669/g.64968  ORF Transcript_28669/g.64968 Transcript_28669/m.64968 type:complete len:425 (-) Transcript_28669:41-1315(-)
MFAWIANIHEAFDFVSGTNDVIVIKHSNGVLQSSQFSVQTNASIIKRHHLGQSVHVYLNGLPTNLHMKIDSEGRCVFPGGGTKPTEEEISLLPVREGRNSLDFRVSGDILASAGLFCWKSSDKIVVVDIDGTITRTDVGGVLASSELGQSLGLVHSHEGICEVLSGIASSGYRLLFLTARPITRADATRKYLSQVGSEEQLNMPQGALVTSALGTFNTMTAVWKDIKAYKVQQLMQIKSLFGAALEEGETCFVGGFGNHDYDAASYVDAGCEKERVFIIDEDSVIRVEGSTVTYNGYPAMLPVLQELFPPTILLQGKKHRGSTVPISPIGGGTSNPFSVNKIPGAALLGEGIGKVWGNVTSTTNNMTTGMGNSLQTIPAVQSLSKVPVPELPKMPNMAIPDLLARGKPPDYNDPLTHGLVDRGE